MELFELLGEIIAEVFPWAFIDLIEYYLPENRFDQRTKDRLSKIAACISVLLFLGLVIGIGLVVNGYKFGHIFIILATVYFVVGIILGIVKSIKNKR